MIFMLDLLSAELSASSEQTLLFGKSVQIVNDKEIAAPTSRPHCKDFADASLCIYVGRTFFANRG